MKKLALATAFVALLTMTAVGAWANAIPQITLSQSYIGDVDFSSSGGFLTSFWLTGTSAPSQCGASHPGCVSGSVLLDPNKDIGTYWIWIVGNNPALALLDSFAGVYAVVPGNYSINVEVDLNNGNVFTGDLALTNLIAGPFGSPEFTGTYKTTGATTEFAVDGFSTSSPPRVIDFSLVSVNGPVSSGELNSALPEPSSLALLGTGVLGLAGVIRRKFKA